MPNNNSSSSNSKGSKQQKNLSDPHTDAGSLNKPGHTLYDPAANPFNLGRRVVDNEESERISEAGNASLETTLNPNGAGPDACNDEKNDDANAGLQPGEEKTNPSVGEAEKTGSPAADASANTAHTAGNNDHDEDDDEDEDDEPTVKRPYVFPPRTPPKKFLPHEILIAIRRVQAGLPVSELCRELGMSNSAFYKWRAKYNGMSDPLLLRMKRLQDHNGMLRTLYVDEKLRTETLQKALQECTHDKVAALKALEEARAQLEAYRNVTWTKKEPAKRAAPKDKPKGK